MAFDKSLDKEIDKREYEVEDSKIVVSIMSYNEGTKKLQISRQKKDKDDKFVFAKLGRLTKEEAIKIIGGIGELLPSME